MFQKRVDQVIARMKADGLKQILVSEPCSIYYLTGVDVGPGERLFALYLNDEGRKVLFLNTLFTVEQKDCEEIWYSDTDDSHHFWQETTYFLQAYAFDLLHFEWILSIFSVKK